MTQDNWNDPNLQTLIYYVEASISQGLMVAFNASNAEVLFTLPEEKWGVSFRSIFDSAEKVNEYSPLLYSAQEKVIMRPHSVKVFIANSN